MIWGSENIVCSVIKNQSLRNVFVGMFAIKVSLHGHHPASCMTVYVAACSDHGY